MAAHIIVGNGYLRVQNRMDLAVQFVSHYI